MQITETSADGLKRELQIVIPGSEIEAQVQSKLQELGRTLRIPGFRPGKVPVAVIKQRYGAAVRDEVRQKVITDGAREAISQRGLRPAFQPDVRIDSEAEGSDLTFSLLLEVLPEFEPIDFATLSLERLVAEVADEAVDEAVVRLAETLAGDQELAEPRPAANGDLLVLDFDGSVDGESLPGMKAEGHRLELGKGTLIPGFEEQLVGAAAGEARTVNVTFPADYGHDRLAGKDAVFQVVVKEIREKKATTIDDAFAESIGMPGGLSALKTAIKDRISKDYSALARTRLKGKLLDRLAETHDFPVPPGMVEAEFETIWQRLQEELKNGSADQSDLGRSEDDLRQEYQKIAERRVRLGLLLAEVGRRNNIKVSKEETQQALYAEAQRHPGHERELFEFVQQNPAILERIKAPVFEDKVVDFILELAQVSERVVAIEELRRELEAVPAAA